MTKINARYKLWGCDTKSQAAPSTVLSLKENRQTERGKWKHILITPRVPWSQLWSCSLTESIKFWHFSDCIFLDSLKSDFSSLQLPPPRISGRLFWKEHAHSQVAGRSIWAQFIWHYTHPRSGCNSHDTCCIVSGGMGKATTCIIPLIVCCSKDHLSPD